MPPYAYVPILIQRSQPACIHHYGSAIFNDNNRGKKACIYQHSYIVPIPTPITMGWIHLICLCNDFLQYLTLERVLYFILSSSYYSTCAVFLLWPRKGSLIKTQTCILDNRVYYTRKVELYRKGKKFHTVWITPILICPSGSGISLY